MPIWHIGKRREALTGNSEVYKRQIVRFLEKRGYYLKASSDVEATFADCILTKRDEAREYWLEAKATTISLGERAFLSQLGKYLAEYVRRTPANRFRMIIACYNVTNLGFFERILENFEPKAIEKIKKNIVKLSESHLKRAIGNANEEDIKSFFEETIVIIANPFELKIGEEKITPSIPQIPTLSDAEYASEILRKFGNVEPLQASDVICLSLFRLSVPKKLYVGKSPYWTANAMFNEKPNVSFPAFQLEKGKLYSFHEMKENTLLGQFADPESVVAIDLEEFDRDKNNERIVIKILNRWIKNECRKLGLHFDKRTRAYYFPRKGDGASPVTVVWKPRSRFSRRELTKPMTTDGKINYWVHRASEIYANKIWRKYYMQIKPRWLFSSDGRYLFEGPRADRLDRAFRKSIYNRNLNRLYDVLFWYRYIFSETDVLGNLRLDSLIKAKGKRLIKVIEQVEVESDHKPNVEVEEEIEKFDEIEPQQVSFYVKPLDEFLVG